MWALLFAPQLFAQRVFVLGDAAVYRPFSEFSRARWLASHERTFWNPYVFAGIPATASLADGRPQYLPDFALDAVEGLRRVPGWPPLAFPLLAHLAGMLSAGLLARALWRAGPAGIAWAGVAWGLMPNLLVPFAFGHDAQFVSASLMPAVLLAIHHLFAAATPLQVARAGLAVAVSLGFQSLAGHPQIVAYTGALAVAFAIERAWLFARRGRLAVAGGAALLGAAISAAVWWPALLYSAHSVRGGPWGGVSLAEVANFSQAPRDLVSTVWPWAVGFGDTTYWGGLRQTDYPQYLGVTACLLALWGWPRRGDRSAGDHRTGAGRASAAWLLLGSAAVAVLMSLGVHLGGLYAFAHAHIPLLSKFRVAVASMIVAQLALALLSAAGLERALGRSTASGDVQGVRASARGNAPRARSLGPPALGIAFAAGLIAALGLGIAFGPMRDAYESLARAARPGLMAGPAGDAARLAGLDLLFRGLLAAGVVAMLVARARIGRLAAIVPIGLVVLLVLDLGSVGAPILRRATGRMAELAPPPAPALARIAARDLRARALPLERATFLSNDWVSWRARSLAGNHGAVSGRWNELMMGGLLRHYSALGALAVRYIAGDGSVRVDTARCEPVREGTAATGVLRLRAALPRAYAVPRVAAPGSDAGVMAGMFASDYDPARTAYASESGAAGDYPGSPRCGLRWVEDLPDRIVLETDSPDRAFVVVADAHFPGWRARVDGGATALYRVNYLMRGVAVPAGRHRVVMEYQPEGWWGGVWLTRMALAVALASALGLAAAAASRRRALRPVGQ